MSANVAVTTSYNGRTAVRKFFAEDAPKLLLFAMHMVMNPVIEVKGETATGRWYIFEPVTFVQGTQPGWLAGRYDDVVYAIDTTTGHVDKIPVGHTPHGVAVWPQPGSHSLGHTGVMR